VKRVEEFLDDPVRGGHAVFFQQVKPHGVDVEDYILGKLERIHVRQLRFAKCFSLMAPSFRRDSSGL